ncbi:MAG: hypothetical protein B7X93_09715 [Hydrogenophilales bacterium 17-61-9]|nr:MAG: hypothetical protein B7X93_09715 [Hydrogenophilales bacterium 17-61-9]
MTEEISNTSEQSPTLSEAAAAPAPATRLKPKPGRHGSGRATARPALVRTDSRTEATPSETAPLSAPAAPVFDVPDAPPAPKKPRAKGGLAVPRSSQAAPAHSLLSLEGTISVGTALAVLRGEVVTLHIETTGPDPLRDEIIAIHARRVRKHRTVAELSLKVLPLRALPHATAEAGRPPAKGQGVPLQEAVSRLLEFLGTHRQHVFVHGSAGVQAFLGQAARQYSMVIENPVGDVVELARLAWPGRADYSLPGLTGDLLPGLGPVRTTADAAKAILGILQAASKVLTASGGLVSRSIVHWGTSPDTIKLKPSPW